MFCLGVGFDRARWGFDLAYCFLMAKDSDVGAYKDSLGIPRLDPDGSYEKTQAHLFSASFRYRF